jgi:hypothetical protein
MRLERYSWFTGKFQDVLIDSLRAHRRKHLISSIASFSYPQKGSQIFKGMTHHIELDAWKVSQCSMVVLSLEAQVALYIDLDLGQSAIQILTHLEDVLLNKKKLAIGLCGSIKAALIVTECGQP